MGRIDVLSLLYAKSRTPEEFNFDSLTARPLLSYLTVQDINALHEIATDLKLASKPKVKYKMIDEILVPRGFKKLASGTNRVVYKYLNDQSIVLKVAYDEVALKDNPAEYRNQFLLKPFCAKVFEVSPCGTVALQERVQPIVTRAEYMQIASDVFDLLVNKILGKYVLDDIGTKYYQNIGLRLNYGPVILDYPYVYELDGEKLHCTEREFDGSLCDGEIDYDPGFNKLVCSKCGKQYFAWQLEKSKDESGIVTAKGEIEDMSILIMRGNEVVNEIDEMSSSNSIKKPTCSVSITTEKRKRGRGKMVNTFAPSVKIEGITTPVKKNVEVHIPNKVKEEKLNENVSATSLGNDINKNIFAVKEEEEQPTLVVNGCGTSMGSLISDALEKAGIKEEPVETKEEKEKPEWSKPDPDEEEVDAAESEHPEDDEETPEQQDSDEDDQEEEETDINDLAVIIENADSFDEDTQITSVSTIKPIKPEEVQDVIDEVTTEYENGKASAEVEETSEEPDLSDAY